MIVSAGEHGRERTLFEFRFDGRDFLFQFAAQIFIIELSEFQRVMQATRKIAPRLNFGFQRIVLFHHLLSLRGIAPKIRRFYFFFEVG